MEFRGAITALVTPFRNGEVDEEAFRSLIEWQIEQGIHAQPEVTVALVAQHIDHQWADGDGPVFGLAGFLLVAALLAFRMDWGW